MHFIFSQEQLLSALNTLPPSWVCPIYSCLVREIQAHIELIQAGGGATTGAAAALTAAAAGAASAKTKKLFPFTLPPAVLAEALAAAQQVLAIVHEPAVRALYAMALHQPCKCK